MKLGFGLRYEEALALEAAAMRRELSRLRSRGKNR